MSEFNIGYLAVGSLAGLVFASLLYTLGGRAGGPGKGVRRYGGSFIIAGTVCLTSFIMGSFNYWLLLIYPIKIGEFSLGYGGHSLPAPIQRVIITLVSCLCGLIFCLLYGGVAWILLALQAFVGLSTVIFSFKNPIWAAAEEPLVCFLNNLVLIFYPFLVS